MITAAQALQLSKHYTENIKLDTWTLDQIFSTIEHDAKNGRFGSSVLLTPDKPNQYYQLIIAELRKAGFTVAHGRCSDEVTYEMFKELRITWSGAK